MESEALTAFYILDSVILETMHTYFLSPDIIILGIDTLL